MSLINVYCEKIPMNWVDTKTGKCKFLQFKNAKSPKAIIYFGLRQQRPEGFQLSDAFDKALIEAIKVKGGQKNMVMLVKGVNASFSSGKMWMKPQDGSEVVVVDFNTKKPVFRKVVNGTDVYPDKQGVDQDETEDIGNTGLSGFPSEGTPDLVESIITEGAHVEIPRGPFLGDVGRVILKYTKGNYEALRTAAGYVKEFFDTLADEMSVTDAKKVNGLQEMESGRLPDGSGFATGTINEDMGDVPDMSGHDARFEQVGMDREMGSVTGNVLEEMEDESFEHPDFDFWMFQYVDQKTSDEQDDVVCLVPNEYYQDALDSLTGLLGDKWKHLFQGSRKEDGSGSAYSVFSFSPEFNKYVTEFN